MRIREIIIPASLISCSWALVGFAMFFVLQMVAWWKFPSPWPGSLCTPSSGKDCRHVRVGRFPANVLRSALALGERCTATKVIARSQRDSRVTNLPGLGFVCLPNTSAVDV